MKNVIVMGATVVNVTTSVMAMSGLVDGQVHVMWVVPGEVMVRPRWTVPTVWTWRDVVVRDGTWWYAVITNVINGWWTWQ